MLEGMGLAMAIPLAIARVMPIPQATSTAMRTALDMLALITPASPGRPAMSTPARLGMIAGRLTTRLRLKFRFQAAPTRTFGRVARTRWQLLSTPPAPVNNRVNTPIQQSETTPEQSTTTPRRQQAITPQAPHDPKFHSLSTLLRRSHSHAPPRPRPQPRPTSTPTP
ncbi:hypothetical protein B0J18DRAFT_431600 [Chaetomium sp. MPI-SDFR-AT-0129]|nr:hypothetical protein B0J18DRAFT_431600 [Chaetomium sp. MPI-SDFR-AT-0129]